MLCCYTAIMQRLAGVVLQSYATAGTDMLWYYNAVLLSCGSAALLQYYSSVLLSTAVL